MPEHRVPPEVATALNEAFFQITDALEAIETAPPIPMTLVVELKLQAALAKIGQVACLLKIPKRDPRDG